MPMVILSQASDRRKVQRLDTTHLKLNSYGEGIVRTTNEEVAKAIVVRKSRGQQWPYGFDSRPGHADGADQKFFWPAFLCVGQKMGFASMPIRPTKATERKQKIITFVPLKKTNNNIMKRTLNLIALVAICSAMMVSCKNAKNVDPTQEEIQEQRVALADSVLAEIDSLTAQLLDVWEKSFDLGCFVLTPAEKAVKPDYLLDPAAADTLVRKSQKINAMAYYIVDNVIRKLYDMPIEETKAAIAKLAADLNHPIDADFMTSDAPRAEKIKKEYEVCKERGDVAYFWQFQNAIITETCYVTSQNPELFFSKMTEDQWQNFRKRIETIEESLLRLAQYDEEMAQLYDIVVNYKSFSSIEARNDIDKSVETAKNYRIANKNKFSVRRNFLLQ